MIGHQDTVTTLKVSPDSQQLFSVMRIGFDGEDLAISVLAPAERHIRTFDGASGPREESHTGSWDTDGKKIAVGAGDGTVVVWSSDSGKLRQAAWPQRNRELRRIQSRIGSNQ